MAFLSQLAALEPGCLILDIRMPAITGLKLQEKLTEEGIDWPVIIISGHGNIEACRRAFHNGAVDFLSKPVDEQDLIDAIQKAHRILARTLDAKALQAENLALLSLLTAREREILERIALGFSSRQIADGLGLSPRTVDSHRPEARHNLAGGNDKTLAGSGCGSVELPSSRKVLRIRGSTPSA